MPRRRRAGPPVEVLTGLDVHRGERVLAWATGGSGEWYVGSHLALHLPQPAGGHRRVAWERIEHVDWQGETDRLTIVEAAHGELPARTTVVGLAETGRLLELIRERVTRTVVCSVYGRVRGSAGLSIVGRRSPSGAGPVSWSYVLSRSLDPLDPVVVEVAEETLARAYRELEGL